MKKNIRKAMAIVLSLAMVVTTFAVFNKTVKADPIALTVTATARTGGPNLIDANWTNPEDVVTGAGYTFGYYVNSISTDNYAVAANNWNWSTNNPSEIRTGLDNVHKTSGGVNFNDGGDFSIIVVIYDSDHEIYAQRTSNTIHFDEYIETNTDAKFKLDRYEQDGKNTVVSWQLISNAKTYTVYNKDTGEQLASAGESSTWTQWSTPGSTTQGATYTAQLVAKDSNGNDIAITNDEITLNYVLETAPDEHTQADFSDATWNELEKKGANKDDVTGQYYINSTHGLNTFFWGIYAPDEDIPYHEQRDKCIIDTPVFGFQWSNIKAAWINGEKYKNYTTTLNNQGDCGEISIDAFNAGINVITLVQNDNTYKTFGIKYVPEGFYDVSTYKSTTPYTYPSETGKIFAGWFTDATCQTPYTGTTGYAYAKFVDKKVLDVKFQKKTDNTAVRFVSTIDESLDYQSAGFDFSGHYGDKVINTSKTITKVYRTIVADSKTLTPSEAFENDDSAYFFTYTIRNMDGTTGSDWTVTPFFVTADGTKVSGTTDTYNM